MTPDPALCRTGVTAGHTVLNVQVWHPNWGSVATAAMRRSLFGADAPAQDAPATQDAPDVPDVATAARMLDDVLGADRAAAWLGRVSVTDHSPEGAVSVDELRRRVDGMAAAALDPDGRPARGVLRVERDGTQGVARVVLPLSPVVAPGCDLHVPITLGTDPLAASDLTMAQIEDLAAGVQDALVATVEENGAGVLAVAETTESQVTLHFYLDSTAPTVADRSLLNTLRTVASAWDLGDAAVTDEPDPAWTAVQDFRV